MEEVKLTQYSHGAGCGCKISPKVLDQILHGLGEQAMFPDLLVGNEGRDDAAVLDIGGGQAIISTTDFFMPIVDDAFEFGRIAAANSISDVYAMGGKPLMAVAILGWPVDKLPIELATKVLEGGRSICREAGIPLAGGHSIDSPEPIFGLAVTGLVKLEALKKNNTAEVNDWLFLTKPLGVGVLSTAQKRGVLKAECQTIMTENMTKLNRVGELLASVPGVTAMTDVTGFGLLGHLVEMAEGRKLSAELFYSKIPVLEGVRDYIGQRVFPDATTRNWSSFGEKISFGAGVNVLEAFTLLPDPQTNGGLLFTVKNESLEEVRSLLSTSNLHQFSEPIGRMIEKDEKVITVLP
ncbi:MAG: selenide, water dikinase SelD [Bacteroidetes bacterium]|nr:selenide, water dikinase SelD [Bacteroidota bacterium]